jgi:Trm5-related predicted tRNA methylase
MKKLKIEKNITLVDLVKKKKGKTKTDIFNETAMKMKVGDSVFVKEYRDKEHLRAILNVLRFSPITRRVAGGFRVWRGA